MYVMANAWLGKKAERRPQDLNNEFFNSDDDWYVGEEENAGVSCLAMIDLNNDLIRIEEVGSSATSTVPVA